MAVLVRESNILKRPDGRYLIGGAFAVVHKSTVDRLILDRRPQNFTEKLLKWLRLPLGSQLTRLILKRGYDLRGSGDDISTYFYHLLDLEEAWPRNSLGRAFDGGDYSLYGGVAGPRYRLCLKVWGMGNLSAPDVARETHLEVFRTENQASPDVTAVR